VPYLSLKHDHWRDTRPWAYQIQKELGSPVFVKPANLGSSVGVHKVREAAELDAALEDAFDYDTRVLIEVAVDDREIELAILENSDQGADPLVSVPGEVARRMNSILMRPNIWTRRGLR
jgi:D-alanine-D-alanine ligase